MTEDMSGAALPASSMTEATTASPGADAAAQTPTQGEGRRTQLKIVRENLEYLSRDIGNFRSSHTASIKRLEKQVAALRSEVAATKLSKDVGSLRKSHDASAKRLRETGSHPARRGGRAEDQHREGRSPEQGKARGRAHEDPREGQRQAREA